MAYADRNDVLARAGRLKGAWSDSTRPDLADIDTFLETVAGEIDAALAGNGVDVSSLDAVAEGGLRGMNADGALILALEGTFPADSGPAAATELLDGVRARYSAQETLMKNGKHPVVRYMSGQESLGASNSWDSEPDYPTQADKWWELMHPGQEVVVHRGQRF